MGKKKNKKDKKVTGAEKTAMKTDKRLEKQQKKELAEKGEDDIEALIAEFKEKDRKMTQIQEDKCQPPSPRCNMTLTAHPERDELVMFGGEYFNGSKSYVYNDLFVYNLRHGTWTQMKIPGAPPPRNSHQAVAVKSGGGQLWVFGGEFESPSQAQFYHYRELWVLHLATKQWEQVNSPNSPSARSGHRMVQYKKLLIVFGGFHDNTRSYKYYNDVYSFNLETYTWRKLEPSGAPPSPRSGCQMVSTSNGLVIYGGFSKTRVKRDVDKGITHTDMFLLTPDGKSEDASSATWKWVTLRQGGVRPTPRCGFTMATIAPNKVLLFGGVQDEEEESDSDSDGEGMFFNDMYTLETDKTKWRETTLRGPKSTATERKRRRKKKAKDVSGDGDMGSESEGSSEDEQGMDIADEVERLKVAPTTDMDTEEASVFQVSQASGVVVSEQLFHDRDSMARGAEAETDTADGQEPFVPGPRMNALLAVKNNMLYLYGGMYEAGEREVTLADLYCLDLHKMDQFKTLMEDTQTKDWKDVGSSSEEDDDDDDEDLSDMEEGMPDIENEETVDEYFSRTRDFWCDLADKNAQEEGEKLTSKKVKKLGLMMCKLHYEQEAKS